MEGMDNILWSYKENESKVQGSKLNEHNESARILAVTINFVKVTQKMYKKVL
jgi:hypothetical protein